MELEWVRTSTDPVFSSEYSALLSYNSTFKESTGAAQSPSPAEYVLQVYMDDLLLGRGKKG